MTSDRKHEERTNEKNTQTTTKPQQRAAPYKNNQQRKKIHSHRYLFAQQEGKKYRIKNKIKNYYNVYMWRPQKTYTRRSIYRQSSENQRKINTCESKICLSDAKNVPTDKQLEKENI